LASGLVNTSRQLGGALGLAILVSVAAQYTSHLVDADYQAPLVALTNGFRLSYLLGAAFAAAAAVVTFRLIHRSPPRAPAAVADPGEESQPPPGSSRRLGEASTTGANPNVNPEIVLRWPGASKESADLRTHRAAADSQVGDRARHGIPVVLRTAGG